MATLTSSTFAPATVSTEATRAAVRNPNVRIFDVTKVLNSRGVRAFSAQEFENWMNQPIPTAAKVRPLSKDYAGYLAFATEKGYKKYMAEHPDTVLVPGVIFGQDPSGADARWGYRLGAVEVGRCTLVMKDEDGVPLTDIRLSFRRIVAHPNALFMTVMPEDEPFDLGPKTRWTIVRGDKAEEARAALEEEVDAAL